VAAGPEAVIRGGGTIVRSMERISSRQNPIVKQFRALLDPVQARSGDVARMLLDGEHLVAEALDSDVAIDVVAVRDDGADGALGALARRAAARGARLLGVPSAVLSAISPVREPSGIVAIARRSALTLDDALANPPQLVLMLSRVQDPGNVGAIVRAADACGATGIITSDGTADPFGWKALRGSMGSAFRIPVAAHESLEQAVRAAKERRIRVLAAVPRGGTPLPGCDLRGASAVLLGGEGNGLAPHLVTLADEAITIPMRPPAESLNVATAAALIAYEAQRQRDEVSR
jgi:RNA methyltransferase, TrmH family